MKKNLRYINEIILTKKRRTDVFRYLISGFTRLREMTKLFVEHSFELEHIRA